VQIDISPPLHTILPTISEYDAAALLDQHPTLTRAALYTALTSPSTAPRQRGLASYLEPGLAEWAAQRYNWTLGMRRIYTSANLSSWPTQVLCRTAAWSAQDKDGEFSFSILHLPGYLYSRNWAKSGAIPDDFELRAQWTMALTGTSRHAFLVLADKNTTVFWEQASNLKIDVLKAAATAMGDRVAHGNPPPLDAVPDQSVPLSTPHISDPALTPDIKDLIQNWHAARDENARHATVAIAISASYENATQALRSAIAPGEYADFGDLRIHHNAKTNRLIEENRNASFF